MMSLSLEGPSSRRLYVLTAAVQTDTSVTVTGKYRLHGSRETDCREIRANCVIKRCDRDEAQIELQWYEHTTQRLLLERYTIDQRINQTNRIMVTFASLLSVVGSG